MARPREFDPQATLQTAIEVFWEKGYFDGSVDEVVKRSGVAKYGIYWSSGPACSHRLADERWRARSSLAAMRRRRSGPDPAGGDALSSPGS